MGKSVFIGIYGLLTVACASQPEGYQLKGMIEHAGNGYAVWQMAEGQAMETSSDTVEMRNGCFIFTGRLSEPANVNITVCPEGDKPALLSIVAENRKMKLTADWADVIDQYGYRFLQDIQLEGSRNHDVWMEVNQVPFNLMKEPEFREYAKVSERLRSLQGKDMEAYNKLQQETADLNREFVQAVQERQKALILANNDAEVSGALLRLFAPIISLEELESMFDSLTPQVQNSALAAEVRQEIINRKRVQPGLPAPDFVLNTPDGGRLALSQLRGKYVLLDFWASWCGPCRASFPKMKEIYARYKDKGLEIVGISNDNRQEEWLKALEEDRLPWKQVIDEFPEKGKPSRVLSLYGVHFLPTLILIDPQGCLIGIVDKQELSRKLEGIFNIEK